jgi:DNA-binding MarR family transcriptional regulator
MPREGVARTSPGDESVCRKPSWPVPGRHVPQITAHYSRLGGWVTRTQIVRAGQNARSRRAGLPHSRAGTYISSLPVGILAFMPSLLGTQVHSADLADAVSRLRRAMRRAARAADPGSGLSVAQLEMLSCMAENPGSRPGQLARLLRLAPSSVATLSNSLRQAGLVTRTGGAGDRRTASLDLTPAGEAAVLRWKSLNERLLSLALRQLPPDSRVTLVDALPALADLAGAVDALADEPSATDPLPGETSVAGETSLA